jgi:hypothetical protein
MAELSNNPFIDHTANVTSRFPDINAVSPPPGPSSPQYSVGWQQQQQQQQLSGFVGTNPTGYTQQYAQQSQWPQQQQYHSQMQASYPPASYQTSSHGQQFVGQADTLATGYPQTHMQTQYTGYPPQQAEYGYQQAQQTGYAYPQQQQQQLLAQFDPYANLGQQLSPTTTTRVSAPTASGIVGSPPPGVQHPRTFIHSHKAELEAWDPTTWRQVQNTFESLKMAWETRKRSAESQVRVLGGVVGAPAAAGAGAGAGFFGGVSGYGAYGGGGYQNPQAQEIDRLNAVPSPLPTCLFVSSPDITAAQLIKEAAANIGE